ncbi:class I SAM-dependent methyltransferase [Geojedonia litorea]|uniref:Class I SAM-dependent methyltransferase n=1 Tax=Geojedonia litorea TaxID=1268269 RepID=A0ABV9N3Y2_9FLAO
MNFQSLYKLNDVVCLTEKKVKANNLYIEVRKNENRVLEDSIVVKLPNINPSNPHAEEWKLRKITAIRFIDYLKSKPQNISILDIGCGNGWFTHLMAEVPNCKNIIGLDINTFELEQAARVFKKHNLKFIYADIFKVPSEFNTKFDIITLNATIQYFKDFNETISLLISFLKIHGELHLLDSPFYKKSKLKSAKHRTLNYYTRLGYPEMANYYHHHCFDDLVDFEIIYEPKRVTWRRLIGKRKSPFLWAKKTKWS